MAELTAEQKREQFNRLHYDIGNVVSSIHNDISNLSAKEAQDVKDLNNAIDDVRNAHNKDVSDIKNDCASIHKELDESVVHIGDSTTELNFDKLNGAIIDNDEYVKNKTTIYTEGDGTINPDVLVLEATTTKIVPHNSIAGATISASNISFTEANGKKHTVAYDDTVEAIANAINSTVADEINNRKQAIDDLTNDVNNLTNDVSNDLYNKVSYSVSNNIETISPERAELDTLVITADHTTVSATDAVIVGNCDQDDNGTYIETADSGVWSGVLANSDTRLQESSTYVSKNLIKHYVYESNSNRTQESAITLGRNLFDLFTSQTNNVANTASASQITANLDKVDVVNTHADTATSQSIQGKLQTAYNAINATVTDSLNKTSASFEVTTGHKATSGGTTSHSVNSFVVDQHPVDLGPNTRVTSQSTSVAAQPNSFSVLHYDQVELSNGSTWPAGSSINLHTNLYAADATSSDPLFGTQQFRVSLCSTGFPTSGANLYFDEKDLLHADAYDKVTGMPKYFKYVYDGYDVLHIAPTSTGKDITYAVVDFGTVQLEGNAGYANGWYIDATNGKFKDNNNWIQVNTGTIMYIPIEYYNNVSGSVTLIAYGTPTATLFIDGGTMDAILSQSGYTWNFTEADLVKLNGKYYLKFKYLSNDYLGNTRVVYNANTAINILDDTGIKTSNLNASTVTTNTVNATTANVTTANTTTTNATTVNADTINVKQIINPEHSISPEFNSITIGDGNTMITRSGTLGFGELQVTDEGLLLQTSDSSNHTYVTVNHNSVEIETNKIDIHNEGLSWYSPKASRVVANITHSSTEPSISVGCLDELWLTATCSDTRKQVRGGALHLGVQHGQEIPDTDFRTQYAGVSLQTGDWNYVRIGSDYVSLKCFNGFGVSTNVGKGLFDIETWTFTLATGGTVTKQVLAAKKYTSSN